MKMRTQARKKLCLISSILAAALAMTVSATTVEAESPDDLLIIANKSVKASKISAEELKAIFLKKKATFKGSKVIPINAREGSSLRKQFRQRVLNMGGGEEAAYWEELKVKKGESNPTEFGNTLKAVFSVKGSIGYCHRKNFKEGAANILAVL